MVDQQPAGTVLFACDRDPPTSIKSPPSHYSDKKALGSSSNSLPSKTVLYPSQKPNQMDFSEHSPSERTDCGVGGWEQIRALDEEENWSERTSVVSKQDHLFYTACAMELVNNLVDSLPSHDDDGGGSEDKRALQTQRRSPVPPASVGAARQTQRRSPVPPASVGAARDMTDEFAYMSTFSDSEFQQISTAQFDVEYLEKMSSNSGSNAPSSLMRESLFVNFDPLVGGRSSPRGISQVPSSAAASDCNTRMSASGDLLMLDTPPHDGSTSRAHPSSSSAVSPHPHGSQPLIHTTGSSPISSSISEEVDGDADKTLLATTLLDSSPGRSPRQSPVPALGTPQGQPHQHFNSSYATDSTDFEALVKVLKYSEGDMVSIVQSVRAQEQQKSEALEEKWKRRLEHMTKELMNARGERDLHSTEKSLMREEEKKLKEALDKHHETENTILDKYEELKTQIRKIEEQRDQALSEFESVEKAFSDFHQRYTKSKEAVQAYQQNETKLQSYISELEEQVRKTEDMMKQLQEETAAKLQEANETFDRIHADHVSELAVMKANLKKRTLQVDSLEKSLQQKEQEKTELTAICDELMKAVGSK